MTTTAEEITQQVDLIARQKALHEAVAMISGTFTDPKETDVIHLARRFYDFLTGDVETASDSAE